MQHVAQRIDRKWNAFWAFCGHEISYRKYRMAVEIILLVVNVAVRIRNMLLSNFSLKCLRRFLFNFLLFPLDKFKILFGITNFVSKKFERFIV